jgi:hypothetical protein
MTWRSLKESAPPLHSEGFLYEPENDGAGPFIWQFHIGGGGRVELSLPFCQWDEGGYTIEENENYMGDVYQRCTHWALTWDVIHPPPDKE